MVRNSPNKLITILLGLILISSTYSIKNKAIILNAGKFFYNYRMENNILIVKNMLKSKGFDERDVSINSP